MTNKDLTWDKIKELANMAVNSEQNFSLSIDADGYVSVDISAPTRTVSRTDYELVPRNWSSNNED